MKKLSLILVMLLSSMVFANEDDWGMEIEDEGNSAFEKMKIKNRAKKEYDDKIYKYIKGDYRVKDNEIELATIELDDDIRSEDIDVNVYVEDLRVEGDDAKGEPLSIKHNPYKYFTRHDDRRDKSFFDKEEKEFEAFAEVEHDQEDFEMNALQTSAIRYQDQQYQDVNESDISGIETIDLRGNRDVKEVNIFIEDTRIIVDKE